MTSDQLASVQRLLAAEFERRGWEYDLLVGRALATQIIREGERDPDRLAKFVPGSFLARARVDRGDVRGAIAAVLSTVDRDGTAPTERREALGMRILFVSADPANEARLRLNAEHRDIRDRIRSATARAQVTLETALAVRPRDLIDELNRHRPTILHLAGHGGPTGIAMEDESGKAADVSTDLLVRLVGSTHSSLRLVVLNTCESSYQAEPIVAHVDAAIGMTREIDDDAAREFSAQLYSSLAEGVSLERAFEQAKLQINLAGLDEDKTPALFVRRGTSADDMVFVARS